MTAKNKDHIENNFRNSIQASKIRMADVLNRHFNMLSAGVQKVILLIFGLATGSMCFLLVLQSLIGGEEQKIVQVNEITVPEDIHNPNALNVNFKHEYRGILHYKHWLDSLNKYDKKIYDSIIAGHPHLPDSLDQLLKRMEQHQINK